MQKGQVKTSRDVQCNAINQSFPFSSQHLVCDSFYAINLACCVRVKVGYMDDMTRLHMAIARAQHENDLPDYLAARIFAMTDQLQSCRSLQDEVDELINHLDLYDTYGQTGYIGMGVDNLILEGIISRLEENLKENPQPFLE